MCWHLLLRLQLADDAICHCHADLVPFMSLVPYAGVTEVRNYFVTIELTSCHCIMRSHSMTLSVSIHLKRDDRFSGHSMTDVRLDFIDKMQTYRWLLARGRVDELAAILERASIWNKRPLALNYKKTLSVPQAGTDRRVSIFDLFQKGYKRTTFLMTIIWFSIILIYFGITLHMSTLGGDIYINTVTSSSADHDRARGGWESTQSSLLTDWCDVRDETWLLSRHSCPENLWSANRFYLLRMMENCSCEKTYRARC